MPNEAFRMRSATAPGDWIATVDAIVRRAPASASQPLALRAQVRLLALLDSAAPLNVLLDGLATYVESWADGLHCTVLLVDPTGRLLLSGAAPSLPAAYMEAIGPVDIADGIGSCGTAAARREMVVVEDVEHSSLWAGYARIALSHGLRACWSVPVLDDAGTLLGTLALYYRERRTPSAHEIDLIQFASFLAAFVIQRQREAEKRRTTDAWLGAAIWGTDVGLWKSGDDGHCVWLDNWHERFDIDSAPGPGQDRPWLEKIHPDDVEHYTKKYDDAVRGVTEHYAVEYRILTRSRRWTWLHKRGRVTARAADSTGFFQSEFRMRAANGEYKWLLDRGRVIERSPDGSPRKLAGISVDIDARRRMETALRESEQRFRGAFEFAAIGMALVGIDGRWIRVNRALSGIVGYTAEELLATTFQAITHPEDFGADLANVREMVARSRTHFDMEKRYFHKDGHIVWVLLSVSLVRDDAGKPLYFVSQIQDITARKQAESQLIDSESRYRIIANLVPGFVFEGVVKDGQPHPGWVSNGFERVYGCTLDRFKELGRAAFYDEATRARLDAGAAAVAQGSELNIEVPLTSIDGVHHWLRVVARAVPTERGVEVGRVLGVAEDITERKRLEQALAAAIHEEQQRLGQSIRDELGQELMSVALLARALAASARKGHQPNTDDLDRLSTLASGTISNCHGTFQGPAPFSQADR